MDKREIDAEIFNLEPELVKHSIDHWCYRILLTAPEIGPFKSPNDCIKKFNSFWGNNIIKTITPINRAFRQRVLYSGCANRNQFLDGEIYSDSLGLALGVCVLNGSIRRARKPRSELNKLPSNS